MDPGREPKPSASNMRAAILIPSSPTLPLQIRTVVVLAEAAEAQNPDHYKNAGETPRKLAIATIRLFS